MNLDHGSKKDAATPASAMAAQVGPGKAKDCIADCMGPGGFAGKAPAPAPAALPDDALRAKPSPVSFTVRGGK